MAEVVGIGIIQVEGDSSGFEAAMVRMEAAARRAEASVTQSLGKAAGAPGQLGKESAELAKQNEAATTRFEQAMQRRTAALLGGASKEREVYAQQKNLNAGAKEQISIYREVEQATEQLTKAKQKQAQADAYLAQLADRANRQTKTGIDYERGNASAFGPEVAKQAEKYIQALHGASNATRDLRVQTNLQRQAFQQLPAQITDIVTSLASGQNAFTVFIQQGGQIKDSFGGIGAAARALASAFNPMTVAIGLAVAAVAAVGYGVIKGADELSAFRRSLVLTGNAAGTTVANLNASAVAISGMVGTQGKAAETLAALASTGRVAAKDLGLLAEAAIRLERQGGPAVEETVKQFAELGRTPTQAVAKLNESTRFLTFTLYEQIKALESQGKTAEAASLAQNAYAAEGVKRAKELEANLGTVERALRAGADTAKKFWDAVLRIGRPSTGGPGEQLGQLEQQLANAQRRLASTRPQANNDALLGGAGDAAIKAQIASMEKLIEKLREAKTAAEALTQSQKDAAAASVAGVRLSDLSDQFKTPSQKLKESLDKANQDAVAVRKPLLDAGDTAGASRQLDAFDAKFKKLSGDIVVYSEAAALGVATRMQAIANSAKLAALSLDETIKKLEQASALQRLKTTNPLANLTTEIKLLEQVAEANLKAEKANQQRLRERLAGTPKIEQNKPAILALIGDIAESEAKGLAITEEVSRKKVLAYATQEAAVRALAVAERELINAELEANEARKSDSTRDLLLSVDEYKRSIDESIESTRLELSLAGATEQARSIAIAQRQIELDLIQRKAKINETQFFGTRDEAARTRQTQLDIVDEAATRAKANIAAKITEEAFLSASLRIRDTLTDAILDGGRSAAAFLKNLFRNLVLRPVVQAFVAPFATGLAGAAQALTGEGSAAGGSSPVGQLASAASLYSAGEKLWAGFNSGFASVGNTVANAYGTAYANATGTGIDGLLATNNAYGTAGGAGGTGTAIGGVASAAAGVAAGIYGGRAISGGYSAIGGNSGNTSVNVGTALGTAVGAYFGAPGVGAAIGGAIGGAVNRLFGRKAPEVESREITGSFTGGDFSGSNVTNILEKGGTFRSDKRSQETVAITGELDKALDEGGQKIADLAKKYGEALGLPVDSLAGVTKQISVEVTTGAIDELSKKYGEALNLPFAELSDAGKKIAGTEEFAQALQKDASANADAIGRALSQYGEALVNEFAPALESLRKSGETTAQTVERVGGSLIQVNEVFELLGLTAYETSIAGGTAAVKLADAFGGLGKLSQQAGDYYTAFFTDAERTARRSEAIGKELAKSGLALPATKEAFRDLVEAQDLTTESGQKAFVALLGVAGAFNAVQESAEELRKSLAEAIADALPKFETPDQTRTRQFTEIAGSLNKVGVTVDVGTLLNLSKADIESFARAFVAFSGNTDTAKLAVVKAASALADLKDSAAAALAEIAKTRGDLNIELLRAQGKEQAAVNLERQRELEALRKLDPALASVKKSIYDAIDAANQAARVSALLSGVDSVAADFLPRDQLINYKASRIQSALAEGGIDATIPSILGATKGQVLELWKAVGIDGREAILSAIGSFNDLQELLYGTAKAVKAYREGTLAEAIFDADAQALKPADRIKFLKGAETALFGQLATADDPVAVAQRLQQVIVSRISEEAELRDALAKKTKDSLEEQLEAVKKLKTLTQEIGQFTASLKFGDSSPLSRRQQVGAAESLFNSTLQRAQGGDVFAQSNLLQNARSFIDEGISAFASGPQAAAIFERVTNALDLFAASAGAQADPKISALQAQIDNLPTIAKNSTDMLAALLSIDAALAGRLGLAPEARSDADVINAELNTAAIPNTANTVADIQSQSTAQLLAQSAHLAQIAIHAAQTSANTAAAIAVDREGFLQAIAELKAMNAQQAAILNELRVGAVPA